MSSLGESLSTGLNKLRKISIPQTIRPYIWAVIVYALIGLFYFLPVIRSGCSTTLLHGPSDQTAGTIHTNIFDGSDPWPGETRMTNYPMGEDTWNPINVSSQAVHIPYWIIAKTFGSVCGYNVFVWLGYIFSALTMFGLLRWLTKRSDVALLGGYMAAFTPYVQIKSGVHLDYVLGGVLTLLIWTFFILANRPTLKRGAIFGLATSLACYVNGYFILISLVLATSLIVTHILYIWFSKNKFPFPILKALLVSGLVLGICLSPLAIVKATKGNQVLDSLSMSRGDKLKETQMLAARPLEYLLPSDSHPVFGSFVRQHTNGPGRGSNDAEYTLYLGWVAIILASYFIASTLRAKSKQKKLYRFDQKQMAFSLSVSMAAAFLISLPPLIVLGKHTIRMPSDYIIMLTSYWRVFARLQIAIVPCLVILAMCGLTAITDGLAKEKRRVVIILCFGLVFFEYLTFWSTPKTWSYTTVPSVYKRLTYQSDVRAIVEFPLQESPFDPTTLSLTYQTVHKKPLLNTYLATSPDRKLRSAVADLTSQESAKIFRTLGIDRVFVHSLRQPTNLANDYKLVDQSHDSLDHNTIYVYSIRPGDNANVALIADQEVRELDRGQASPKMAYILSGKDSFSFRNLIKDSRLQGEATVSIHVTTTSPNTTLVVSQSNLTLAKDNLSGMKDLTFKARTDSPLEINTNSPNTYLQINDVTIIK